MAGPEIEFHGKVSREEIDRLYSQARALVFPGIEDLGIVQVEAQAKGCPVIAYGRGGALETVTDKTGVFFHEQSPESLKAAVLECEKRRFLPENFRKNVGRFTNDIFLSKMSAEIKKLLRA